MKSIKYVIGVLCLCSAVVTGCKNPDKFQNVIYFTGTEETAEKRLAITGNTEIGLSVTCSERVKSDVEVSIALRPDLVEQYNLKNATVFPPMPAGSYELSSSSVAFEEGKNVSSPMKLSITDASKLQDGVWYLLPVEITGVKDNAYPVLEASRVIYTLITPTMYTTAMNAPSGALTYNVPSFLTTPELASVNAMTMEIRAYADAFTTTDPYICSIIGIEENFLLRMGDVTIGLDQIQLAGGKYQTASNSKVALGRWYHFAVVYDGQKISLYIDGKLDASRDAPRGPINLTDCYPAAAPTETKAMDIVQNQGFRIGASTAGAGRPWKGTLSEARVWSRALTPGELKNNMCYVDPHSEGLIAYWHLNNSASWFTKTIPATVPKGTTTITATFSPDLTGHGHDARVYGSGASTDIACPIF